MQIRLSTVSPETAHGAVTVGFPGSTLTSVEFVHVCWVAAPSVAFEDEPLNLSLLAQTLAREKRMK